ELRDDLALLHLVVEVRMELDDTTGDLCTDLDRALRGQRAVRGHLRGDRAFADLHRGERDRRRPLLPRLLDPEERDATGDDGKDDDARKPAFDHDTPVGT